MTGHAKDARWTLRFHRRVRLLSARSRAKTTIHGLYASEIPLPEWSRSVVSARGNLTSLVSISILPRMPYCGFAVPRGGQG